jgi:hypothetical protein
LLLAVFLLVCGVAWYLFRPEKAFINNTANEPPPPGVPADTAPGPSSTHAPEHRYVLRMVDGCFPVTRFYQRWFTMLSRTKFPALALLVASVFLCIGVTQAQEKPAKVLGKGQFHDADKTGKGTAKIYQLADGKRVLRLTDFAVENGPDLHVRLIAANDAKNTASVAKTDHVDLGKLKGNKGDQNYDVPEKVDLSKYKVVSIWCNRFSINFAAAPLKAAK